MFNFPTNPVINDNYTIGTKSWKWNGFAWDLESISEVQVGRAETAAAAAAVSATAAAASMATKRNLTDGAFTVPITVPAGASGSQVPRSSEVVSLTNLASTSPYPIIGGIVFSNTDVNVPADFSSITAAWNYIRTLRIAGGATLKLKVANGTYNESNISMNHPDGANIQMLGNETTPANCIIQPSTSNSDCLYVSGGNKLGRLNGFTIRKAVKATATDNSIALTADTGGTVICGPQMKIDNWYYGAIARNGGTLIAPYIHVDHAGDVGVWAYLGGTVYAPNAISNNASDEANNWGFGFQAEAGSVMDCSGSSATGCLIAGIAALHSSMVRASGSNCSSNSGSGFYAATGSEISAGGSTANNNVRYGAEIVGYGQVLNIATATENGIAPASGAVDFSNSGPLGARILSNLDMRIDVAGANSWYFNSSGGVQFMVQHTASAVNRICATGGASGNGGKLFAYGSDAAIRTTLASKGADVVALESNGAVAFQCNNPSSAVNFGQVDGAPTGGAVTYKARGSDLHINIAFSPKGDGCALIAIASVRNYANDAAAATGGIPVGGIYRNGSVLMIRAA